MSESSSSLPVSQSQIVLIGVGTIVMGAFLPWDTTIIGASAGISSLNGILTLVTGVGLGAYTLYKKFSQRAVLAGGGLCLMLSVTFLVTQMSSAFSNPAIGVYTTLLGGLILVGVGLNERNNSASED